MFIVSYRVSAGFNDLQQNMRIFKLGGQTHVSMCVCVCEEASFPLATYRFAPSEEQLVSCQGEIASFPALDELPADLLLLQLPLDQRLSLLVHN